MKGIYKRGSKWWIDYQVDGKRYQESTKAKSQREAARIRSAQITKRSEGTLQGQPGRVRFADLRALVEQDYLLRRNRSLDRAKIALTHLEAFFGKDAKVPSLTATRINSYAEHRLREGAADSTIGYEKAQLRRAFRLAIKNKVLAAMPYIETPPVENQRSGFFTEGELAALKVEMLNDGCGDVWDLVDALRLMGWRRDELRLLQWTSVDRDASTITLEGARSKSGEPRIFPFARVEALKALLEARWAVRDSLYVFSRDGKPLGVGAVRSAWKRATKRAGMAGKLVHDLRRTCARNMRRAGLAESDIMELSGWETREMFKRYCIKDEAALEAAAGRAYGYVTNVLQPEGTSESGNSLSSSSTT